MAAWRNERGGAVKTILILAVVVFAGISAYKYVSTRGDDKAIIDGAEEVLKFAGAQFYKAEDIQYRIAERAQKYGIPVKREDIKVADEGKEWHVTFSYDRDVNYIFFHKKYTVTVDKRNSK